MWQEEKCIQVKIEDEAEKNDNLTRKLCEKNDKIFYTHAQLFFHFPA
jgi:hypothetical protein